MLSDQDVERELKAALAVSPSPDFEARVLQRVEADRPSRWPAHSGWFAAAASLIIVAGVFSALNRTSSRAVVVPGPPVPQVVASPAPRVALPRSDMPVQRNVRVVPRAQAVRASRNATRTAEPEVLVPPDQMEAVRSLVRAVNEGRLEVPAEPPQGPMAPPVAIGFAPVAVTPIPLSPLGPGTDTATPNVRDIK